MDDERLEEIWDEIWSLLEEGQSEAAVGRVLGALNEESDSPELRYLLGVSLVDLDEVQAAIPELQNAAETATGWADAHSALAWALFRDCRFEEARAIMERALALDAGIPEVHQLRGLLAERAGDEATALVAFAEARRLDPEGYPEPLEMDEEEFLSLAQAAVSELDEKTRALLDETALFVQDFPAEELLTDADPPLDPQILGLFLGRSLLEQSVQDSGTLPNTIYLFRRNLERAATTRKELEDEIRITVLHEIAHHFGWGEEDLDEKGFG